MSSIKQQQILVFPFFLTVKSVIPVELPEGKSGQQAFAIEKLQKRAELMGATKTGTWCVNCETYQAITTFSKSVFLSDLLIKELRCFWGKVFFCLQSCDKAAAARLPNQNIQYFFTEFA